MSAPVNGQMADSMGNYMGDPMDTQTGGHMGGVGGQMSQVGQMPAGQQIPPQQHPGIGGYPPLPPANHPGVGSIPSVGGGIAHGMGGPGASGIGAINGGMMGGMIGGMVGFPPGAPPIPQRAAKKVPDWLVQTLKEKEALAEKQKKKVGASLSTDVASSLPGGAGNISGYNLVHSPSPSPPGSPSDRRGSSDARGKPSWQDDSDDSADEVSPTRANREKRATNGSTGGIGSTGGGGGVGGRNGVKPSGILKKGGTKKRGAGRVLEGDGEDEAAAAQAAARAMDNDTRASFDREIRRLLTQLLKEGTANISREVASSAVEEARHSAIAAEAARRLAAAPQAQPKVKRKEQKKAIGALIGGYGSGSASESDAGASPAQAAAPSATISGDVGGAGERGREASNSVAAIESAPSPAHVRKPQVMVGGKWPLPTWADPPHEAPLPDGVSVVVETIGPNLERVKMQELSFSTTVMGRFEEQCGFVVEDSSASRCHAAIL